MNNDTRQSEAQEHLGPVAADAAGMRLDKWLAQARPELSRTRLKALIEDGRITCDGATIAEPARAVKPGQIFCLTVPPPEPAKPEPEDIPLKILYEDADLLVLEKPAGLVVHPAPGNPKATLVNALLAHCGDSLKGIGGVRRPGIVHRLDKDTSGLMVAAKTETAHKALAEQFAAHSVTRSYLALVWGIPSPPKGEISGNIGRSATNRKKMAVVKKGGKTAITRYKVLKRFHNSLSLIECRLLTGRTHQIRVHLTALGHPLVGDPVYGRMPAASRLKTLPESILEALKQFPRQALHANVIGFEHPATQKLLHFESNLYSDINLLINKLESV